MLKFKKESAEVIYSKDKLLTLSRKDMSFLEKKSLHSKKKIFRLCAHKNTKDKIHQMFIVHPKNYFVHPHKHKNEESMFVLKGSVDIVLFNNHGKIKKVIKMGDYLSSKTFFYKLPRNTFHTLIINSKKLVFFEITKGPFSRKNFKKASIFGNFDANDLNKKNKFVLNIKKKIRKKKYEI